MTYHSFQSIQFIESHSARRAGLWSIQIIEFLSVICTRRRGWLLLGFLPTILVSAALSFFFRRRHGFSVITGLGPGGGCFGGGWFVIIRRWCTSCGRLILAGGPAGLFSCTAGSAFGFSSRSRCGLLRSSTAGLGARLRDSCRGAPSRKGRSRISFGNNRSNRGRGHVRSGCRWPSRGGLLRCLTAAVVVFSTGGEGVRSFLRLTAAVWLCVATGGTRCTAWSSWWLLALGRRVF